MTNIIPLIAWNYCLASILRVLPRFKCSKLLWNLSETDFQIEGWKHGPGFPDYIFVIVSHEEAFISGALQQTGLVVVCHCWAVLPHRKQEAQRKAEMGVCYLVLHHCRLKIMGNLSSLKWGPLSGLSTELSRVTLRFRQSVSWQFFFSTNQSKSKVIKRSHFGHPMTILHLY